MNFIAVVLRGSTRYEISAESQEILENHLNQLPETDLVERVMIEIPFDVKRSFKIGTLQDFYTSTDSLQSEGESDMEPLEMNDEEGWASRLVENTSG